jgi:hypothetical protein
MGSGFVSLQWGGFVTCNAFLILVHIIDAEKKHVSYHRLNSHSLICIICSLFLSLSLSFCPLSDKCSTDSLILAIKKDITIAKEKLKEPHYEKFKNDTFLTEELKE